MTIIASNTKELLAECEEKLTKLRHEAEQIATQRKWAFIDDVWVDPTPFQAKLAYDHERRLMVHTCSERLKSISFRVRTWEEAIRYAMLYDGKRAKLSKVRGRNGCVSILPATILNYGYEKDKEVAERIIAGDACIEIDGGYSDNGGHHTEKLTFSLVEDLHDTNSRYVEIDIEVTGHAYNRHARVGSTTFSGPSPYGSNVVISYGGERLRWNSDGSVRSGSYMQRYLLNANASIESWLPKTEG